MKANLTRKLLASAQSRKEIRRLFAGWKKQRPKDLDTRFHAAHEEAFEQIDCLDCANCCKTTSPIFKERDIVRLAKHLKLRVSDFSKKYLQRDADGDWVLQSAPCPFLDGESNRCSVYSERPQACREFPHTNRKNMHAILDITEQNAHLCPAVATMVASILQEVTD